MKLYGSLFLILIASFLQNATTIPLTLIALFLLYIFNRQSWVIGLAFVAGLLLDTILLGRLGGHSLFFVVFLLLVVLYDRKFEIKTVQFVFVFLFVGSLLYLFLFGGRIAFFEAIVSALMGGVIYKIFTWRSFNGMR